jgi:hypothetical protein
MAGALPFLLSSNRRRDKDDPVMDTTAMLLQLAGNRPSAPAASPTVSGADVIGLGAENTNALMNRLQQSAQFEAALASQERARSDRQLEGMGETVFRAREQEQLMKERRRAERQVRKAAEEKARREDAMGTLVTLPDGSMVRRYYDPASGTAAMEPFADAAPAAPRYQVYNGVLGSVDPETGRFVPVPGAPVKQQGGAGGAGGNVSMQRFDEGGLWWQWNPRTGETTPLMVNGVQLTADKAPPNLVAGTPGSMLYDPETGEIAGQIPGQPPSEDKPTTIGQFARWDVPVTPENFADYRAAQVAAIKEQLRETLDKYHWANPFDKLGAYDYSTEEELESMALQEFNQQNSGLIQELQQRQAAQSAAVANAGGPALPQLPTRQATPQAAPPAPQAAPPAPQAAPPGRAAALPPDAQAAAAKHPGFQILSNGTGELQGIPFRWDGKSNQWVEIE